MSPGELHDLLVDSEARSAYLDRCFAAHAETLLRGCATSDRDFASLAADGPLVDELLVVLAAAFEG